MANDDRTIVFGAESDLVPTGTQLNHMYEIESHVASGGMGEVYKGHELGTGDKVAIKIVLPERARDPANLALFHKEASVLRRLAHSAIVRYLAFALDRGINRYFMAMEFVDGESLAQRLQTKGPMTSEEARRLLARVASGLAEAHEAGVVHRDLSPDNIILPEGNVNKCKIIDFGIAKAGDIGGKTIIDGRLAGKLNFMAPEQLGLYGPVTEKSDIYSLGLVMVAALRGAVVDMGETLGQAVDARRRVLDLSDIDPDLRPLLTAMLEPLPANRPASIADIAEWLRSGGRGSALPPAGRSEPPPAGTSAAPYFPAQDQRTAQPLSYPPTGSWPGAKAGPQTPFTAPPQWEPVPDQNAARTVAPPPQSPYQRPSPPAPQSETFGYAGTPPPFGAAPLPGNAPPPLPDPSLQSRSAQTTGGPYPPTSTQPLFGPVPPGYGAEQVRPDGALAFPAAARPAPAVKRSRGRGGFYAFLVLVLIAAGLGAGGYYGGFLDRWTAQWSGKATQGGEGGQSTGNGGTQTTKQSGGATQGDAGKSANGGNNGTEGGATQQKGKSATNGGTAGTEGGGTTPQHEENTAPAGGTETKPDTEKPPDPAAKMRETTQSAINAFDGGPCFFATIASATEKSVVVTGYGVEQRPFEGLLDTLRKATGLDPDVNMRLVERPQCPALGFLHAASALASSGPQITLSRLLLALSEPLSGKVQVPDGAAVNLLYVDAEGFVQGLDKLVKPESPGERSFAFSLGNKNGMGSDGDSPRLIILLTSPKGIDAARIDKPQSAADLFPKILDALKDAGPRTGIAVAYFKIVAR